MPTHSAANDQLKQLYVDEHFCYTYKIGIVTNGLGIVRHLDFYNKDFLESHPDLIPNKKSDSPDEDKSIHDARLLIPTLQDFFRAHPLINPKAFLGDAPLNSRSHLENINYKTNEDVIPCCPKDETLPMKYGCISKLRSSVSRYKFICPKMIWDYNPKRTFTS